MIKTETIRLKQDIDFAYPYNLPTSITESYSKNYTTGQLYHIYVENDTVYYTIDDGHPILLYKGSDITEMSACVDQSGGVLFCLVEGGKTKAYINGAFTTLPAECRNPRLTLDRWNTYQDSDLVLAYLRGNKLCYRMQSDRYQVEKVFPNVNATGKMLWKIGMNREQRLVFQLR